MSPPVFSLSRPPRRRLPRSVPGKVPGPNRGATPIKVKATAGLRMLGQSESEAILEATRNKLEKLPFHFDRADGVEIMGGLDEAYFAWVTINYLMGLLATDPERTAVMLDLGGGSTQIAMSVPRGRGNVAGLIPKSVLGSSHAMFLHSYLGYGLMAASALR